MQAEPLSSSWTTVVPTVVHAWDVCLAEPTPEGQERKARRGDALCPLWILWVGTAPGFLREKLPLLKRTQKSRGLSGVPGLRRRSLRGSNTWIIVSFIPLT